MAQALLTTQFCSSPISAPSCMPYEPTITYVSSSTGTSVFAEPDNESLLNFWVHLYYSCSKEPTVQDPEDQNPKAGLLTRLD